MRVVVLHNKSERDVVLEIVEKIKFGSSIKSVAWHGIFQTNISARINNIDTRGDSTILQTEFINKNLNWN